MPSPTPLATELDKYYTKPSVAQRCYEDFRRLFVQAGVAPSSLFFFEPSAGNGSFLRLIQENKCGTDLHPENPPAVTPTSSPAEYIRPLDFLDTAAVDQAVTGLGLSIAGPASPSPVSPPLLPLASGASSFPSRLVFLGNPPFGTKASLAVAFLNQTFRYGHTAGFILPLQLRKWSGQKRVLPGARLVLDGDLPEDSFSLSGKDYPVRCCFQVWTTDPVFASLPDLRLASAPPTTHPDFLMYQYNRTAEAKKYFDLDWDFAILRQGYGDYTKQYLTKQDCDPKQQWIFFKASSPAVLANLRSLDFVKLSRKNIGIPGFGKADVVLEYRSRFG